MQQGPLVKLLGYILPSDFAKYFDLIDVKEEELSQELLLHLYLDEKDIQPVGLPDLNLMASMQKPASMISLSVTIARCFMYVTVVGRTRKARATVGTGSWRPKAHGTRKSLPLF